MCRAATGTFMKYQLCLKTSDYQGQSIAAMGLRTLTHFGPQRIRFCFDAQHGSDATGKRFETIRHIPARIFHFS